MLKRALGRALLGLLLLAPLLAGAYMAPVIAPPAAVGAPRPAATLARDGRTTAAHPRFTKRLVAA